MVFRNAITFGGEYQTFKLAYFVDLAASEKEKKMCLSLVFLLSFFSLKL